MMSRRKKSTASEKIISLAENKYKLYLKNFELTEKQHEFLKIAFDKNTKIVFVSGPAGSSKTFISIYAALQLFNMNMNQDLFYVRTIAESGERNLGSLPGDVDEKTEFDIELSGVGDKKINVIKVIRTITSLGLKPKTVLNSSLKASLKLLKEISPVPL